MSATTKPRRWAVAVRSSRCAVVSVSPSSSTAVFVADGPTSDVIASLPMSSGPHPEALLPVPVGTGRFVIRATHERGVGAPPSRSLSTATHEAAPTVSTASDISAPPNPSFSAPFPQRRVDLRYLLIDPVFVTAQIGPTRRGRPQFNQPSAVAGPKDRRHLLEPADALPECPLAEELAIAVAHHRPALTVDAHL